MNRQRIIMVVVWVGVVVLAEIAGTTQAGSHDYEFVVDQSQSDLEFLIYMDLGFPLGSDSDAKSSPVTGTLGATLTPEFGSFSNIHITDLALDLVNDLSFDLFGGLVTGTGSNLGLLMGGPYGSAGPATTVSSGSFSQTGNLVQPVGVMELDSPFGSDTVNLIDKPAEPMDFVGTVVDDGSAITITAPVNMYWDLNELAGLDGYVTLSGSLVAQTATYYPPPPPPPPPVLSLEMVPVSDPQGLLPPGYRTYDVMATVETNLAAFEMIVEADTPDSIFKHTYGSAYTEPMPVFVATYPELEFDTYVTLGAWEYPSPTNVISGAIDIVQGSALTFDDQDLNILWALSDGTYQSGPGTFPVARVTLKSHATASYTVMGWQTGDDSVPVTIEGAIAGDPQNVSMYMEEAADQTGVPEGYTTYDFLAVTDTNLAAFEMILEADTPGSIYQHAYGSAYTEPMPAMVATYPELEFDTYVTMGAWEYPSPTNVISGAIEIDPDSVLTFDEQTLNILWALSDGTYKSGPGVFRIARVTLANNASATWTLMGWQTGDEWGSVTETGVIDVVEVKNRGDVTGDGFVGADDLVQILSHWGESGPAVSWLDGDCAPYPIGDDFVGADDYVEVLSMWGTSYPAEPTPEPATLGLLLLGGLAMLRRRR